MLGVERSNVEGPEVEEPKVIADDDGPVVDDGVRRVELFSFCCIGDSTETVDVGAVVEIGVGGNMKGMVVGVVGIVGVGGNLVPIFGSLC